MMEAKCPKHGTIIEVESGIPAYLRWYFLEYEENGDICRVPFDKWLWRRSYKDKSKNGEFA